MQAIREPNVFSNSTRSTHSSDIVVIAEIEINEYIDENRKLAKISQHVAKNTTFRDYSDNIALTVYHLLALSSLDQDQSALNVGERRQIDMFSSRSRVTRSARILGSSTK